MNLQNDWIELQFHFKPLFLQSIFFAYTNIVDDKKIASAFLIDFKNYKSICMHCVSL